MKISIEFFLMFQEILNVFFLKTHGKWQLATIEKW
jgi:hypothetical protein